MPNLSSESTIDGIFRESGPRVKSCVTPDLTVVLDADTTEVSTWEVSSGFCLLAKNI
jgi:hypothetical protein